MAETEFIVDVEAVSEMANGFISAAGTLKGASQALETAVLSLKDTALVGSVGDLAMERFLSNIKPQMDHLVQKCTELSQDLSAVIARHQNS
jgi:hypothetical protein